MTQTVLITGASRGLGLATARAFAEAGWQVAATMRNPDNCPELGGYSGVALIPVDVTDEASVQRGVQLAVERFGRIDLLINNAGYVQLGYLEERSDASYRAEFETNFFGSVRLVRAVLPTMRKQGSGRIINITSYAGSYGQPLLTSYSANKFALTGFTESLHHDMKRFNISVINFEPGGIRTDLLEAVSLVRDNPMSDYDKPVAEMQARFSQVMERFGSMATAPEKVAERLLKVAAMKRPPLKVYGTYDSRLLALLKRLLPDGWFRPLSRSGL